MAFWSKAGVVAAIAFYLAHRFGVLQDTSSADLKTGYGMLASIAATMLGFVLAALAILLTVANTRLLRNMRKTGHFGHLLGRMLGVTVAFGVVMIFSLGSFFVPVTFDWLPYVNLALFATALIGLWDICRKLWLVLTHLNPD